MEDERGKVFFLQLAFAIISSCVGFIIKYLLHSDSYNVPLASLFFGLCMFIIFTGKIMLGRTYNGSIIVSGITAKIIAGILLIGGIYFILLR